MKIQCSYPVRLSLLTPIGRNRNRFQFSFYILMHSVNETKIRYGHRTLFTGIQHCDKRSSVRNKGWGSGVAKPLQKYQGPMQSCSMHGPWVGPIKLPPLLTA